MKNKHIVLAFLILVSLSFITGCSLDESSELHDHSVEIEGKDMKLLSVREVAELWEIDSEILLSRIIEEVELTGNYTVETTLEEMREEYPFSPALIKNIAEDIKQKGIQNE